MSTNIGDRFLTAGTKPWSNPVPVVFLVFLTMDPRGSRIYGFIRNTGPRSGEGRLEEGQNLHLLHGDANFRHFRE